MSVKKRLVYGVAGVIGIFLLGSLFVPNPLIVEESITIHAPVDIVFDLVNRLPENEKWSPWVAADPSIKNTYSGKTEGVGAWMAWTGDRMGSGKMTITTSRRNEALVTELDFGKNGKAEAYWSFVAQDDSVLVTWRFMSNAGYNPLKRYMAYFIGKPMIQRSFVTGLTSLKRVAEAVTAEQLESALHSKPEVNHPSPTGATN